MNATATNSGGLLGGHNIGGLGYGIGVSVGILLLITTITLASYFCARNLQAPASSAFASQRARQRQHWPAPADPEQALVVVVEQGLDEATITGYPKLLYSEAKLEKKGSTASCCSVCLGDYKDTDMLRVLPDCSHLFHQKCIDPWLRLNPTCPVCRTSPLPTPLATPLAEVVPLAIRRD
ncbi:hypothetical protein BT93_K1040 [Corymbia citriodora subsp. variegata]|nr:hypothetical protein BT93_K1040 [Corymbia citriodora subsp. variegata]